MSQRGHIHRRGRTWTIVYNENPSEDGKRKQKTKGGFRTRKEAQAELTRILSSLGDGSYVPGSTISVAEYLRDEWLPAIRGSVRPATFDQYRSIVRTRIVPHIGGLRLQGVTGAHLNGLYRTLEENGYEPSTIRSTVTVLSKAFRDGVRHGRLVRSPVPHSDPPKMQDSRAVAWTAGELGRFLRQVEDDRLFAAWRLVATTGARRGEVLGLSWQWVDLEGATVRIEQQLRPSLDFGPPKSRRSRRQVALDAETVDALSRHRDVQLAERAVAGPAYEDRDLVFADEIGRPISPRAFSAAFHRRRRRAGIPVGTLHVLRHTHATLALTSGVPLHVVAARLGDRPETMLRTYAHLLPTSDAAAAEQVAALLAG